MWVRERERERERETHTHTHTHTHRRVGRGEHMFLVQNFDGQFGVGGILELGFEEPRWGLTVCGEGIH
jgi:hypothetical protein